MASPPGPTPFERIATALEHAIPLLRSLVEDFHRLAEHLAPAPSDLVGSKYIAERLGVSTVWVAEMARRQIIPPNCVAKGTGSGKLWRFHRELIDRWIAAGRPGAA